MRHSPPITCRFTLKSALTPALSQRERGSRQDIHGRIGFAKRRMDRCVTSVIQRKCDVFGDLTKQDRGNVSAFMERHGCAAAIFFVVELFVRAALADFYKT